tara:strand:- start:468 stop:743 length:276 start_codon:yes stop_codon:yes gene_type:complete
MIEITTSEVFVKSGTSKRTGQPYSIREQNGYMHKKGTPYPEKIKITLGDNDAPYQPGNYTLHPESFFVDRFGSLAVRPKLIANAAEQRKAG